MRTLRSRVGNGYQAVTYPLAARAGAQRGRRDAELAPDQQVLPGRSGGRDVDLGVRPGETVGVVGENGAGKSTLMKIVSGVYPAGSYEGELAVDGVPRQFRNVRDAEEAGVVLVPQELHVAPGPQRRREHVHESPAGAFRLLGSRKAKCNDPGEAALFRHRGRAGRPGRVLSPSEQRLVTIASALAKSARLIILDEPTAALTESEAKRLYSHIRKVCAKGVACLYISHRLDEIEQIADRVVVMRNGRVAARLEK